MIRFIPPDMSESVRFATLWPWGPGIVIRMRITDAFTITNRLHRTVPHQLGLNMCSFEVSEISLPTSG